MEPLIPLKNLYFSCHDSNSSDLQLSLSANSAILPRLNDLNIKFLQGTKKNCELDVKKSGSCGCQNFTVKNIVATLLG